MKPTRSPGRIAAAARRELELAAAVAREAVTQHHINSALRLIELGAGRVPASRMLEIYLRLHGIADAAAERLTYSVLAALGQQATPGQAAELLADPADDGGVSIIRVLRNRLRGRTHHDLRRQVELATGAAHAAHIELHVRHSARFAETLHASHSITQASEIYAEMVAVPKPLRDAVCIGLLDRIAARELPRHEPGQSPPAPRVALYPGSSRNRRAVQGRM